MLACKACLSRAPQTSAVRKTLSEASLVIPVFKDGILLRQHQRAYVTDAAASSKPLPDKQSLLDIVEPDTSVAQQKKQRQLEFAVKKHLEHMDDPYQIALHVKATLSKDRYDEALLLVTRASKAKQVVVAWNHLIDYLVEKKRINAAITLLNDMKKRGQMPNEQTYTIIFRGCAKPPVPQNGVSKAVRIYNSLLKENSRVKPNSIHLNAVLQACGRAGDIEAMFAIADTADPTAGRQPTAYTYTAILNTLRAQFEERDKTLSLKEQMDMARKTIQRCKSIWEEVMRNWRKGNLVIDQDLVCSMARVLLLGNEKDRSEILRIFEETMSVRDLTTANQEKGHASKMDDKMKDIAHPNNTQSKGVPRLPNVFYAVPRSNALSVILTIFRDRRQVKLGLRYWDRFVYYYGVKPDTDNWHQLIRLYERSGSSREAVKTLERMPLEMILPIFYRRVLATCVADNMNPEAFANATRCLDLMVSRTDKKTTSDVRALLLYMKAATTIHFSFRTMAKEGDAEGAKRGYSEQLAAAVNNLWEPFHAANRALTDGPDRRYTGKTMKQSKDGTESREELIDLARKMIGAVDKIVREESLADERSLELLKQRRNQLNRLVVQSTDRQQQNRPASKPVPSATDRLNEKMWEF
ncbi:Pentatricopeptide repeat-containing protein 2, mitochondrial [Colletotrichum chlorophyti]|uniref:Pentatricopeptide repeat-containing protein 2, mitochondrial n=1 Tax=Colletotrichum chlorophyti TaxID=708187 RepID=A0A1Q8RB08_9PEZI|nr:Pentatricopeptide repeat-containing protein 2, mitochondrial [Colletotrichum chlorophyti]